MILISIAEKTFFLWFSIQCSAIQVLYNGKKTNLSLEKIRKANSVADYWQMRDVIGFTYAIISTNNLSMR